LQQWTAAVSSNPYNLTVNYVTNSSGQGRSSFASGTYDYGMSDIPYPPDEQSSLNSLQSGRCHGQTGTACFVYVPVTAGALSFPYNVTNNSGQPVTNLELTPTEACKIFTGAIQKWDDPLLLQNNPSLAGISSTITPVVRSDPAGESYVLSQYCIAKDPGDWDAFISSCYATRANDNTETCPANNATPTSEWPGILDNQEQAVSINGADQSANAVSQAAAQNEAAITYVAAGYAVQRGLPMASVQNAAGNYVQPNSSSVSIALGYAQPNGDGTFTLDFNGSDPGAYFPSTYSYILAQTGGFDATKGATLAKFICYDLGFGQVGVSVLRYASLNSQVVGIAEAAEEKIPGWISPAACTAGAPAAPAPPNVKQGDITPTSQAAGTAANAAGSGTGSAGAASATGSAAGATGSTATTTCAPTSSSSATSTSTTVGKGATSTTTPKPSTTTTSTTKPSTTTTSTTAPCALSGATSGPSSGPAGGKGTAVLSSTDAADKSSGSSLAPILEGAGLCAVGLAFAGLRKRSA
jgi:ABC-type phosphate transport system substrate-binding protein